MNPTWEIVNKASIEQPKSTTEDVIDLVSTSGDTNSNSSEASRSSQSTSEDDENLDVMSTPKRTLRPTRKTHGYTFSTEGGSSPKIADTKLLIQLSQRPKIT